MGSAGWFLLVGGLMLAMGSMNSLIRHLPVTSAMVYLSVGLVVGPIGFGFLHFNPLEQSALLEILTEIAVLVSLFSAGVKMPVPFRSAQWKAPIALALLSMAITVALVAAFAHLVLGIPLGAGVLLGAIIAPTDPVLATDVQTRNAQDSDQLRFTLTCEAGMNDGSAFPFVMLGLGLLGLNSLGNFGQEWLLVDALWATAAGIGIGVAAGAGLAHLASFLGGKQKEAGLLDDFLGLGLIGAAYGLSLWLHAWGFLAVFFAAVALRQTELRLAGTGSAEESAIASRTSEGAACPVPHRVSEGSLVFKEHLERLSELVLILLIGGMLFLDSWSWRGLALALFLFFVARPLSVAIGLAGTRTSWRVRGLVGWFGVRGIGSLFYLMFAIQHGLPEELAVELIHLTLVVITLSILFHGISVKPVLKRFWDPVSTEVKEARGGAP